jgi:pteridine reductase
MMTKSLALELAPQVRVNGVAPGAILWPAPAPSDNQKQAMLDKIPLQTLGSSQDIAATVAFLVADAPYISGQILAVDGGRSVSD